MTVDRFIQHYQIQPADAIVMRKKFFGMVDHYVIYVGVHNGKHCFVANYTQGVKEISNQELNSFLQVLQPTKIDRFPGPADHRPYAVAKAISQVGKKAYSYISNNCEHFKNWVHTDDHRSDQVNNAGNIVAGVGVAAAVGGLAKKNTTVAALGLGAIALGLFLKSSATDNNKKK